MIVAFETVFELLKNQARTLTYNLIYTDSLCMIGDGIRGDN